MVAAARTEEESSSVHFPKISGVGVGGPSVDWSDREASIFGIFRLRFLRGRSVICSALVRMEEPDQGVFDSAHDLQSIEH